MALAAVYQRFLAAPNPSYLSEDATLNYITTTTTFRGASDIIQHLSSLRKQINKKKENVLSLVHGQNAIAAEVETGLEFVTSGASYLPALDDNFLTDRTVYIPVMHIVTFGDDGKILNIRQSWDQGALLKQLDVIGKTGRNWPIRDSKDQIKMIENCVKSATGATPSASHTIPAHSKGKPASALRDPHASLSLFESREEREEALESVISPRGGPRPRQRDFTEILGDEPDDAPSSPSAGRQRSDSPNKAIAPRGGNRPRQRDFVEILGDKPTNGLDSSESNHDPSIAPKIGAGKNFQPSRLFEVEEANDDSLEDTKAPSRFYRPHPEKYKHFEFDDGSDLQDPPQLDATPQKTKHTSQWSFDDFVTPAKVKPSKVLRHQETHQWEPENGETLEAPLQAKPRRDAEAHFEFVDDGNASPDNRPVRPRGATHNNGLGLYQNNLYDEEGKMAKSTEAHQPLGTITNMKDRGRDFDTHWAIADDGSPDKLVPKATVSDDRKKAVKMMEPNWAAYDESPIQKENKSAAARNGSKVIDDRGISIGGDGMGGGKGSARNWLFGDEDNTQTTKTVPGRKPPAAKTGGFNWDF
ncbi:hypothetical protein SAMD00023353_4500890 [Rosellinia necatrix]|uniref:NTF2-like protein n=1 Tax=Rosellinia necatrix TaxID=77044 RepID=A0A1W2TQ20_ROSNE|nr:hypothetical protein SAMD00023353_4500890 [Rosellinia necatrix]